MKLRDLEANLAAGPAAHARKKIVFPMPDSRWNPEKGGWDGAVVEVDVKVLDPSEDELVLAKARADAIAAGVDKPGAGEPLYERAIKVHTLAFGLIDHESPEDAPSRFFDTPEQIRKSKLMTTEVIAYLYAQQEAWQEERSPRRKNLTEAQYLATIAGWAGGNIDFFEGLERGTVWSCARITASRLLDLLTRTSPSGSSSTAASSTSGS